MGTVTAFKDIGLPSSTRPRGISRQSFLVYLLDLRIRVTVAFLDFVTLSPLILRIHLGIKFLFVRLRFRYPFFSPIPHDINLGSRFRVRRQLRPGGLSPQTDGMPVIHKKREKPCFPFYCTLPTSASCSCGFCWVAHLMPQLLAKMIRLRPFRSRTRLDSDVRLSVLGSSPSLRIQRTH